MKEINKVKLLIAFFLMACVFMFSGCKKDPVEKAKDEDKKLEENISQSDILNSSSYRLTFEEQSTTLNDINIKYPLVRGLPNDTEVIINTAIENHINKLADVDLADENINSLSYRVTFYDKEILSIVFSGNIVNDGKESEFLSAFNYNLSRNVLVGLRDYINYDDSSSRDAFTRLFRAQAENHLDKSLDPTDEMGIYFEEDQYEIYVVFYLKETNDDTKYYRNKIKKDDLKNYVNDEYKK